MDKTGRWIKWMKKLPNWLQALIGFVTIIITFLLLFRSNFDLGIITLAGIVFFAVFFSLIYVVFAKTAPLVEGGKGVYLFEKYRPLALLDILFMCVLLVIVFSFEPTRSFIYATFSNTPTSNPISIEQLLFSSSETHCRLEVTLKNSFQKDVLVSNVSVSASNVDVATCCPSYYVYVISDTLRIVGIENGTRLIGAVADEKDPSFSYPVDGFYEYTEFGAANLMLHFNTSFLVPANKYSSFYLLLPKSFRIVDTKWFQHTSGREAIQLDEVFRFRNIEEYNFIYLSITTNSWEEPIRSKAIKLL